ncbi:hypothetical protein [Haloarcula sediminis]|uniref:hypothetical protein n=1 Tax=Haloarcula sediminis TaxID=3111777 RepID=UPI002D76A8D2|nr:hypothetical protein [Haloarcula sp. CK38]
MDADHPHDGDGTDSQLNAEMEALIESKTAQLQARVEGLESDRDQLQARVKELEGAQEELQAELEAVTEELAIERDQRKEAEAERDQLRGLVSDLESDLERIHDIATTAVGKAQANENEIGDLDDRETKTRDIAKSAIAKAQQLDADPDKQEDAETLPEGIEPSSSPLDFFANVRQSTVKEVFVEQANKSNTYRAIQVAKRWPEFATKRHDGSGVFLTKDDVTEALTAELGSKPHRQTVHRVWDKLQELGGQDLRVKTRQVGTSDSKTEILTMSMETAQGLNEQRYAGLDLLEDGITAGTSGGVTPVVTGQPTHAL